MGMPQLSPQWRYQAFWKYGDAILAAFAIADNDGSALDFDILYA
jgi:hypothetical protein